MSAMHTDFQTENTPPQKSKLTNYFKNYVTYSSNMKRNNC